MNTETPRTAGDTPPALPATYGYAGFWKRAAAAFMDGGIIAAAGFCVGFVWALVYGGVSGIGGSVEYIGAAAGVIVYYMYSALAGFFSGNAFRTNSHIEIIAPVIIAVICWLYFAWFESSRLQSTPGKMVAGIKVTGAGGNRVSFGRASGRHFGKMLSFMLYLAGYAMAAFTQKKQGLHDILAGCLVVNKTMPAQPQTVLFVVTSVTISLFATVQLPLIRSAVLETEMCIMGRRAGNIYASMKKPNAGATDEPRSRAALLPKAGKRMEEGGDISGMRFENSSDYFTVLFDGERMGTTDWSPYPYSADADYSKCAGAGVPRKKEAGRLTAANNAWIVAANVTDDMPDSIPIIISRNIDPASLIPGDSDLKEQCVLPSGKFHSPLGDRGFVMVLKGGLIAHGRLNWRPALAEIYMGADAQEIQRIRTAFEKIEYLTP